jgi:hypothetical protein
MSLMDNGSPLLGKCKHPDCNYVIFATRDDVKPAEDFREVTAGTGVYKVGNNGFFARCSNRHKFFAVKAVKGTYSPDHKCDARCLNAKGWSCTCSCGGANHGRGHVATVVNASELPAKPPHPGMMHAPGHSERVIERTAGRHLGEVGKHIRGEVMIESKRVMHPGGPDTTLTLYTFITEAGDTIKWWIAGQHDPQWEQGKTLTIRAKVKRHESHERFGNSTVVIYVEEVE